MRENQAIITRLEISINEAVENDVGERAYGADLLAAAGEALGALKVMGSISVSQMMYDMARLAAQGGHVPDDFEAKANR